MSDSTSCGYRFQADLRKSRRPGGLQVVGSTWINVGQVSRSTNEEVVLFVVPPPGPAPDDWYTLPPSEDGKDKAVVAHPLGPRPLNEGIESFYSLVCLLDHAKETFKSGITVYTKLLRLLDPLPQEIITELANTNSKASVPMSDDEATKSLIAKWTGGTKADIAKYVLDRSMEIAVAAERQFAADYPHLTVEDDGDWLDVLTTFDQDLFEGVTAAVREIGQRHTSSLAVFNTRYSDFGPQASDAPESDALRLAAQSIITLAMKGGVDPDIGDWIRETSFDTLYAVMQQARQLSEVIKTDAVDTELKHVINNSLKGYTAVDFCSELAKGTIVTTVAGNVKEEKARLAGRFWLEICKAEKDAETRASTSKMSRRERKRNNAKAAKLLREAKKAANEAEQTRRKALRDAAELSEAQSAGQKSSSLSSEGMSQDHSLVSSVDSLLPVPVYSSLKGDFDNAIPLTEGGQEDLSVDVKPFESNKGPLAIVFIDVHDQDYSESAAEGSDEMAPPKTEELDLLDSEGAVETTSMPPTSYQTGKDLAEDDESVVSAILQLEETRGEENDTDEHSDMSANPLKVADPGQQSEKALYEEVDWSRPIRFKERTYSF